MSQPRSRTAFRQSGCQARGWDRTTPVTGARAEALPGYMILVVPPAQATLPWVSHRSPHNSVRDLVAPQPALRKPQANCRPVKTCWWEEPLSSLPPTCRHRNVAAAGHESSLDRCGSRSLLRIMLFDMRKKERTTRNKQAADGCGSHIPRRTPGRGSRLDGVQSADPNSPLGDRRRGK